MQRIEETPVSELSFGRALAYLSARENRKGSVTGKNLSGTEQKILEFLKDRLSSLKRQTHLDIHQQLPSGPCEIDKPYFEGNEDIFIEMLILASQSDKYKEECQHIWRHLNDCYHCFHYFCKVMRAYSLTVLEFIKEENNREE